MSIAVNKEDSNNPFLWVTISLLSIAAVVMILWGTQNYGVSVSPDGKTYLYYAGELAKGNQIDLTVFPPLYPALLAALSSMASIEPFRAARLINAFLFGLTIFFSGLFYKRTLNASLLFLVLAVMSVMVAIPLLPLFLGAYSEPLFIVLVLLALICLDSYLRRPGWRQLIVGAVALGLACATRYAGVIFIFSWALSILVFTKSPFKKKIFHIIVSGVLAGLPLVVILLQNYFKSGSFTGTRISSSYSYLENAKSMVLNMLKWYIPGQAFENSFVLYPFFFLLGFGIALYYKEVWQKDRPSVSRYFHIMLWILGYLAFLMINARTTFLQLIDNRYLAPIFIPANLLVLAFFQELFKLIRLRKGRLLAQIAVCLFVATWLIYPLARANAKFDTLRSEGEGFSSRFWRENATLQYIVQNFPDRKVYSNNYHAIIFHSGQLAYESPRKYRGTATLDTLESLRAGWPEEGQACLVWFDHIQEEHFFTPEELLTFTTLEQLVEFPDGTVYYLSRGQDQ